MSDERWIRIDRLLQSALGRPQHEREAFIREACADDDGVRDEVLSLLAHAGSADKFLEPPPERKPLQPGAQLGAYEIRAQIGEGGMGEVYRAHDSRLRRDIALKILPPEAADAERRHRFAREAQAVAALNHPGIVTIHSVEQSGDIHFLTMELVDGQTLDILIPVGGLPIDRLLALAVPLADAVGAAHSQGIVHRDLKPTNVMVTRDGRVKVMDFGLAKLSRRATPQDAKNAKDAKDASATTMSVRLTEDGRIFGTVAYMSPEQAEGRDVDHRSDVFSLGVMLFELATGRRPFTGDSQVALLASIVKDTPPPVTDLKPGVPADFARLVRKCLAKDPGRRYQSVLDVRNDLEEIRADLESPDRPAAVQPAQTARRARSRMAVPAVIVMAAIVGMALESRYFRGEVVSTAVYSASISPPSGFLFGQFAVSPDGRWIAFTDEGADGTYLWVRSLDRPVTKAVRIADTAGASHPFWSPDSLSLGFFANRQMKTVDLAGGRPRFVCDVTGDNRGGTWNSDGVILFTPDLSGPVYRVSARGGDKRAVTTLDASRQESTHRWPVFLPDGHHFIYFARAEKLEHVGLYLASIDAPEGRFLAASSSHAVYAPPGLLLYVRDAALVAQHFDARTLQLTGDPVSVVPEVGPGLTVNHGAFSASATGVLAYGSTQASTLTWFTREGRKLGAVGEPDTYTNVELADNDRAALVERPDPRSGANDVYVYDFERQVPRRLTTHPASDFHSMWWPGSRQIAWASNRTGVYEIYRRDASGAGEEELLPAPGHSKYPSAVTPGGRFLIYEVVSPTSKTSLNALELSTSKSFPLLESGFNESQAQLSPDGRWMAYSSDRDGRSEIYVVDARLVLPGPGEPAPSRSRSAPIQRVSRNGGAQPMWRRDGKVAELFYVAPDRHLMVAAMNATGAAPAQSLFEIRVADVGRTFSSVSVSRDAQRFLVLSRVAESGDVTVVFNWPAVLR